MIDLSIVIPSYKDPLLEKTIQSILDNFISNYEIIPIIDGYNRNYSHYSERVRPVILEKTVGMRDAINAGVASSRGRFIMRTDEHCMFGKNFDSLMIDAITDNQIMTARRYFLDPVKWEIMADNGYIDYEKLIIKDNPRKFSGVKWKSRSFKRADIDIDETMAMQGSSWIMSKYWWDKVIDKLDSSLYGTHYQDTTEMIFKTWQAGGKLMLNKRTWYAHKHRSFSRTHQYPTEKAIPEWLNALRIWEDYYTREVAPKWAI